MQFRELFLCSVILSFFDKRSFFSYSVCILLSYLFLFLFFLFLRF